MAIGRQVLIMRQNEAKRTHTSVTPESAVLLGLSSAQWSMMRRATAGRVPELFKECSKGHALQTATDCKSGYAVGRDVYPSWVCE